MKKLSLITLVLLVGCGLQSEKVAVIPEVDKTPKPDKIPVCSPNYNPIPLNLGFGEAGIPISDPAQLPAGRYVLVKTEIYMDHRDQKGRSQVLHSEVQTDRDSRRSITCKTPFPEGSSFLYSVPVLGNFARAGANTTLRDVFSNGSMRVGAREGQEVLGRETLAADQPGFFSDFMNNAFLTEWRFYVVARSGTESVYEVRAHWNKDDASSLMKIQIRHQFKILQ